MTIKVVSIVHVLAFLPGVIGVVLSMLPQAPFPVNPAIPWVLLLVSAVCVYVSNYINSIFNPPVPPAK